MKTKKINIQLEEVKVVDIMLNLGNLDNYKNRFLALKNHERETREILQVRGYLMSDCVSVVILIDEHENETKQVERVKDFIEQFGKVEHCEVTTAWILDKDTNGIDEAVDYEDWFVF